MMLRAIAVILLFTPIAFPSTAQDEVLLLIHRLDASVLIRGLPLLNHQVLRSGDGRTKQLWDIKGVEFATFEVIGNIQSDADSVGWQCHEFDADGNVQSPARDSSFCRKFFVNVLKTVVDRPTDVADDLILAAEAKSPGAAIKRLGDISIETDGEFYSLRRLSRL